MQSLLLIPDISGFTRFIHETETEHGRHIVAELLEIIIDSNALGLTVAEIEGDAVLFYGRDTVPTIDELTAQAERMFINFHSHLRDYDSKRICRCGACTSAASLTLKLIAHVGPIQFISVKDYVKPFGPDVILVHRLLKNNVDLNEYLLVTEQLVSSSKPASTGDWASFSEHSMTYDDIGEVRFQVSPMALLLERVPTPPPMEDFKRTSNPVTGEVFLNLPISDAYELVSNLGRRLELSDGIDDLRYETDRVNRVGTKHQCVVRGDFLEFETVTADYGPSKLVYGERLLTPPLVKEVTSYTVLEKENAGTRVRMEFHYRSKPFPLGLLSVLFRLGVWRLIKQSIRKLTDIAEQEGKPEAMLDKIAEGKCHHCGDGIAGVF